MDVASRLTVLLAAEGPAIFAAKARAKIDLATIRAFGAADPAFWRIPEGLERAATRGTRPETT